MFLRSRFFTFSLVSLLLLSTIYTTSRADDDEEQPQEDDNDILDLDAGNVKKVLEEHEHVMMFAYAHGCDKSSAFMPHYVEAATKLRELGSGIVFTRLDGTRNPRLASSIGIKGFPVLVLYSNLTFEGYRGEHAWQNIVTWGRKKSGFPVHKITSVDEAAVFVKEYPLFIMGFFEKFQGKEYEEFVKAAKSDNETLLVEVDDRSAAKILFPDVGEAKSFIGVVKSVPEKYTKYDGDFKKADIMRFIEYNKFPLITKLTSSNALKIYSSPIKNQVMIFADNESFLNLVNPLQEIAKKFKSKVMVTYVNKGEENLAQPFISLFGFIENYEQSTVVIAFNKSSDTKYLLELEPTPSNIEDFFYNISKGIQKPYYKSEEIPHNMQGEVHVVVGKTFDEMVLESDKHFFLEIYTPGCDMYDALNKKMQKLAKHFRDWDNLVIGKYDASKNEHPKIEVKNYPALLLYVAGDKGNPVTLIPGTTAGDLAGSIKFMIKSRDEL